jgi:hypothetical protein
MDKITPHIDMRTKVVYGFKCDVYRGNGLVAAHCKTKGSKGTLTSISENRDFIEHCETKRLDLEDYEFWSDAYLPEERTIETPGSYEGKLIFDHVSIRIISSNEPLLGCGPLPDWFRKRRCIHAVDKFDDNLCVWRCLAIYMRRGIALGSADVTKEAKKLARDYYGNAKLKVGDVRATKLVDFEGIARHHNLNIRVFEPKYGCKTVWQLVYGKGQYKQELDTIDIGMYKGHCFFIKNLSVLCKSYECSCCNQKFTQACDLTKHKSCCNGAKTRVICNGKKF